MENESQTTYIVIILFLAVTSPLGLIIAYSSLYKKRLLKQEAELKEAEYGKQRLIHQQQIDNLVLINNTEEKEKERIAKNLHDGVLPLIATLGHSLAKNLKDWETNNFDINRFKKDIEGIEQIGITLRGISHDLIPPYLLSFGLISAIQDFIEQVDGVFRGKANFENKTKFKKHIPMELADQLNVYRISLELLNNINKHTKYKYLTFVVEDYNDGLLFEIQHDGIGASTSNIHLPVGAFSSVIIIFLLPLGSSIP